MRQAHACSWSRASEVVGQAGDAEDLLRKVGAHKPEIAAVDVRMPAAHTDEGPRAAQRIRAEHPDTAVFVLSRYVEEAYALEALPLTQTLNTAAGEQGARASTPARGGWRLPVHGVVHAMVSLHKDQLERGPTHLTFRRS